MRFIKRFLLLILIFFIVSLIIKGVAGNNEIDSENNEFEEKPGSTSLSLVMVGDALIHRSVYDDAKIGDNYDFKPMLEIMKPIISKYDLAYYNQETILGGKELGLSTYPRFNSPYEVGDAFLDAGFNLISLANNHTLDRGEQALLNSCEYWKNKNAYVAGSYCSYNDRENIKIYTKNNIKYALLSYTTSTNGLKVPNGNTYYVNTYNKDKVKEDIEKYRDKTDLLIVAMHWGEEYKTSPNNSQREIAKYLASLGVDIVVGAHPHVVEPIEKINDTLVIYSLGNFISAQIGIDKLTGLMVSVKVIKDLNTDKISLSDVEVELLHTYYGKDAAKKRNFKVYPYTMLNEELLPSYKKYYNKYMNVVTGESDFIKRGDYSGNSK